MSVTRVPPASLWFLLVVGLFIGSLITANVIAVKLVLLGGLILPAGVIVFPLSYIVGDVLTEVYGYGAARRVIWIGFLANLLFVVAALVAGRLPAPGFWEHQAAYDTILGFSRRLLAASFVAYLVGEFANSYILARLKVLTRGRWLWTRTISSTLVGQGLDTATFVTLAFLGTMPGSALLNTIVTAWLFKTLYEVVATPLTYVIVNGLKQAEGVDVFDEVTDFNPLAIGK